MGPPTTYTIISSVSTNQQQTSGDQQQQDLQQNSQQNSINNHPHNQNHHELITATNASTGELVTIQLSSAQLANFVRLEPCQVEQTSIESGGVIANSNGQIILQGSDLNKQLSKQQQQSFFETATILGSFTQDGSERLILELSDDATRQLLAQNSFQSTSTNSHTSSSPLFSSTTSGHHLQLNNHHSQILQHPQTHHLQAIPNIITKRTQLSSPNSRRSSRKGKKSIITSSSPSNSTNSSSNFDHIQNDFRNSPGILLKAEPSPPLPTLKCDKCPKVYTGKTAARDLTRHHRDHHLRGERFRCSQCSCSFLRPDNLTEHLRVHRAKEREHQVQILQQQQQQQMELQQTQQKKVG